MISFNPSVEYILSDVGQTAFDCRWNTPRRMGIGDKIVACASIQQISSSGYDVSAYCNCEDDALFDLFGIQHPSPGSSSVIPWTDHVMAVPLGMTLEDTDAADLQAAHPVERALWGIGLHRHAKSNPDFSLRHKGKKKEATIAWSPIELTRGALKITAEEWEPIIAEEVGRLGPDGRVVCWCAMTDQPKAMSIVQRFGPALARRISVRSANSLSDWVDGMASAEKIVTANTGGMWIGLGLPVPMLAVQREATIPHQAMWQARPGWNTGRVSVMQFKPVHVTPNCTYPHRIPRHAPCSPYGAFSAPKP